MSISEQMQTEAKEGQKIARKLFVIGLDFSLGGLSELDDAADNVDVFMPGGTTPENVATLTKSWGAYLGEVLRREAGAEWIEADNEHGALLKSAAGQEFSPHEQIRQRVTAGAAHSLSEFAQQVTG